MFSWADMKGIDVDGQGNQINAVYSIHFFFNSLSS